MHPRIQPTASAACTVGPSVSPSVRAQARQQVELGAAQAHQRRATTARWLRADRGPVAAIVGPATIVTGRKASPPISASVFGDAQPILQHRAQWTRRCCGSAAHRSQEPFRIAVIHRPPITNPAWAPLLTAPIAPDMADHFAGRLDLIGHDLPVAGSPACPRADRRIVSPGRWSAGLAVQLFQQVHQLVADAESRLPVGSSPSSIRARATATRCSPPESSSGLCLARLPSPTCSRSAMARLRLPRPSE